MMENVKEKHNLVIAHCFESLQWVERVDSGKYKTILVSKTQADADIFQTENIGFEASSYLQYIVKYYDELPCYSVFVHGHECSYHHVGSMPDLVNGLCFDKTYKNINGKTEDPEFYCHLVKDGHVNEGAWFHDAFALLQKHTLKLFHSINGIPVTTQLLNRTFCFRMCAQFLVHRDLIRRHTKEQWLQMLLALNEACKHLGGSQNKECAQVFEYAWFTIFTGLLDEKAWNDEPA